MIKPPIQSTGAVTIIGNDPDNPFYVEAVGGGGVEPSSNVAVTNFPNPQNIAIPSNTPTNPLYVEDVSPSGPATSVTVSNFPPVQDVDIPSNSSTHPLFVQEVGSGNVTVTNWPTTQPVSGSVSVSNFPSTQNISGTVAVSNLPVTQPVSGTVSVGNFPAIQNVAIPSNNASTPLFVQVTNPTAPATSVSVTNFPSVQPISGAVTVSNLPATQPVSGSVAITNFPNPQNVAIAGNSPSTPLFVAETAPLTVSVSNWPASQAVSGTVSVGNWPSLQAVDLGNTNSNTNPLNINSVQYPAASSGNRIVAPNNFFSLALTSGSARVQLLTQPSTGLGVFFVFIYISGMSRQPAIEWVLQGQNTVGGTLPLLRGWGDFNQTFAQPFFLAPSTQVAQGVWFTCANNNAIIGTLDVDVVLMGWWGSPTGSQ